MKIQQKNKLIAITLLIVSMIYYLILLLLPSIHLPQALESNIMVGSTVVFVLTLVVGISKINAIVMPNIKNFDIQGPKAKAIIQSAGKLNGDQYTGWVLQVTVFSTDRPEFDAQILSLQADKLYQAGDEVSVVYDSNDQHKIILADDQLPNM